MDKLTHSLAEVAEMTGFPLSSIEADCRKGRAAHIHYGRERRMTPEQITLFLNQHTVKPSKPAKAELDADELDRARAARRTGRRAA